MDRTHFALAFTAALLVGILVMLDVGVRLGRRRLAADPDGLRGGTGAVEGVIFALLGLLVAFTFSSAAGRFDDRRQLIVEESNNIGTAWLRLDLLEPTDQPTLRALFRQYVDSRIEVYRKLPDIDAAMAELNRSAGLQTDIWKQAVAACDRKRDPSAPVLVLPAINAMIDVTATRTVAAQTHTPPVIMAMLFVLAMTCALFAGHGMAEGRRRSWLHILGFAVIIAASIYLILDLGHPRFGIIRIDHLDQLLVDVRRSMG